MSSNEIKPRFDISTHLEMYPRRALKPINLLELEKSVVGRSIHAWCSRYDFAGCVCIVRSRRGNFDVGVNCSQEQKRLPVFPRA